MKKNRTLSAEITVTATKTIYIDNDMLESMKDDCYYVMTEAIEDLICRQYNISESDIPPTLMNEIMKIMVEKMHNDYED